MNDCPDIEALSAYLDAAGVAVDAADAADGAEVAAHLTGCAGCRVRVAELAAVADWVATPVEPAPAQVREAALAAALAAWAGTEERNHENRFLPTPPNVPGGPGASGGWGDGAGRRVVVPLPAGPRSRPGARWLAGGGAAAAVVTMVVVAAALLGRGVGTDDTTLASPGAESLADAARSLPPAGTKGSDGVVSGGDLGVVTDLATVVPGAAALVSPPTTVVLGARPQLALTGDGGPAGATNSGSTGSPGSPGSTSEGRANAGTASNPGSPSPVSGQGTGAGGSLGAAPGATVVGSRPCEAEARAASPRLGPLVYLATATYQGSPVIILGFSPSGGVTPLTVVALAQQGCRIVGAAGQ